MHRLYLRLLYIVERSKLEVKSRGRVRIKGWSRDEDTESRGGVGDERASSQGSQGAKGAKDLALGKAKMPRD